MTRESSEKRERAKGSGRKDGERAQTQGIEHVERNGISGKKKRMQGMDTEKRRHDSREPKGKMGLEEVKVELCEGSKKRMQSRSAEV